MSMRAVWMMGVVLALSGCAGGLPGLVDKEIGAAESCRGTKVEVGGKEVALVDDKGHLSLAYVVALARGRAGIDPLLDCALADARSDEEKYYRGHVIVSLLAVYGAANLEGGAYEQRVDDAVNLLTQIEKAEYALRRMSPLVTPDALPLPFQDGPVRVDQVLYTLELALSAERPRARRRGSELRSLVGALAAGSVAGVVEAAVGDAVRGLGESITFNLYSRAYLKDARADLAAYMKAAEPERRKQWGYRDQMITAACERIGQIAGVAPHCLAQ